MDYSIELKKKTKEYKVSTGTFVMDDLIAIHQHNIAKWQHIKQAMLSKLFL